MDLFDVEPRLPRLYLLLGKTIRERRDSAPAEGRPQAFLHPLDVIPLLRPQGKEQLIGKSQYTQHKQIYNMRKINENTNSRIKFVIPQVVE